jgi:Putative metal-binding motif
MLRTSAALLLLACNSGIDAVLHKAIEDTDPPASGEDGAGEDVKDTGGPGHSSDTGLDDDPCADPEVPYDGEDNDCDPSTPDDDLDADGHLQGDDCDEANPEVHPGAAELCDGLDNDCDGEIDGAGAGSAWHDDLDGDGYGDPDSSTTACEAPEGSVEDSSDCDDSLDEVHPGAEEPCNGRDDDCDSAVDEEGCDLQYGGHRIDKGGSYYYVLYNDHGFGVMGASSWYGSTDAGSVPEGLTWNEDQTVLYYNGLSGDVWAQSEPFTSASTRIGSFGLYQVGGGVFYDGHYYVGEYSSGDIHVMDVSTGATSVYARLGSAACKPYFGNSSMSIDVDGRVFAASTCGMVAYSPASDAVQLNRVTGLLSAVAMDAAQELYGIDSNGTIYHFDKSTGATLGTIRITVTPYVTWTMAVDGNGDFVLNYWGDQRVFSSADGSLVTSFSAASYYPGTSRYYWYVTF